MCGMYLNDIHSLTVDYPVN